MLIIHRKSIMLMNKCHTWSFLVCFYSICFFIYGIQHIYQNYGALILCFQESCCLDSMFLVSITVFEFWNYVASILCSFFFTVCAFWNYVASIPLSLIIYAPYLEFNVFTTRQLCCLDSIELERGGLEIACERG